jgi:hypothetical protein
MKRGPYQIRLLEEYAQLQGRIQKLTAFIQDGHILGVDKTKRKLLYKQHSLILTYSGILAERLSIEAKKYPEMLPFLDTQARNAIRK